MSSVYDRIPRAGHINYSAAKGGVRMLAQTLAREVAADRIRVNAVAPGAVRTPINKKAWDTDEALRKLLELIPMAGSASPRTSRRQSPWPASDEADHVTGATLFVDGRHDALSGAPREWLSARKPQSRRCSPIRFRAVASRSTASSAISRPRPWWRLGARRNAHPHSGRLRRLRRLPDDGNALDSGH
jgi:hypothetical protein